MEFELGKCGKIVLKRGKLVHSQHLILDFNREIQKLKQGKTFKYPGIEESEGIQHQQMKERWKKKCTRRLRMISKSELNTENKITAIRALAVPVSRYSFGIFSWRLEEIRKTKKVLTVYEMHHPKGDIDRLYVKGKEERRGFLEIEVIYKAGIMNIAEYLNTKYTEYQFVNIVKSHKSNQPDMNSTVYYPDLKEKNGKAK